MLHSGRRYRSEAWSSDLPDAEKPPAGKFSNVTNFTDPRHGIVPIYRAESRRRNRLNPCWVLIVTRGLRVWLPPEVYLQRRLAEVESQRWRAALRLPVAQPRFSPRARFLHLIASEFPDSWRACPVWVGVTWSAKTYPRLRSELMATDEKEATTWFRRRTPKSVGRGSRSRRSLNVVGL